MVPQPDYPLFSDRAQGSGGRASDQPFRHVGEKTDPGAKRDIVSLTKFSLRMLARRALTLEEEISEIDAILKPLVNRDRTRTRRHARHRAPTPRQRFWSRPATIPDGCATRPPSPTSAAPRRSTPAAARTSDTASTAAAIARPTLPSGTSCSPAWSTTLEPPSTSIDAGREGLTKKEAVRCLKRYVAREVFSLLPHEKLGLDSP